MGQRVLFTIGHSTRSWEEFVAILKAWKIEEVVDVRTVPKSRAYPWFGTEKMAAALPAEGIRYEHLKVLGGFRPVKKDSMNEGWQNASFRGYADYMQTPEFQAGLDELNRRRRQRRVCIMCSEAVWWRCHRRMIADAETARGIPVKHIMGEDKITVHELTAFAVVKKRKGQPPVITYPQATA
jgi:uncharacterized protein (DUF488 family)